MRPESPGAVTLALNGWLDTETAPQLGEMLAHLPGKTEKLTLDLSDLEYISSAGIRQLVAAHKIMSGNLTIEHASPEVLEIMRMTGVIKRLSIR